MIFAISLGLLQACEPTSSVPVTSEQLVKFSYLQTARHSLNVGSTILAHKNVCDRRCSMQNRNVFTCLYCPRCHVSEPWPTLEHPAITQARLT
jgi:hypothetical protein